MSCNVLDEVLTDKQPRRRTKTVPIAPDDWGMELADLVLNESSFVLVLENEDGEEASADDAKGRGNGGRRRRRRRRRQMI